MRKNPYFINALLAAEVAAGCLAAILVRAFMPAVVLPRISVPLLVLLSLIPLVTEHYLVSERRRYWLPSILLAGLTYSGLPMCAGLNVELRFWTLFLVGAAVFGMTAMLYTSIGRRMDSGPGAKLSPVAHALGLYLASQCLQGLL